MSVRTPASPLGSPPTISPASHAPKLGLGSEEAAQRLREEGPNEITHEGSVSALQLLLSQFKSAMIWLLLGACVVSGALGELLDAIAIGTIVVLNALVGFFQEYRAERAIAALRSMTAPRARVVRDGRTLMIPAKDVVRGDLLVLEAGDIVAADAHLLEANLLTANEAALTGESLPVDKSTTPADPTAPLGERRDTVFMGTTITNGTGRARVAATGMHGELGKVARLLATAEKTETPLQVRLAHVSRLLLYICLGIVAAVAVASLLHGRAGLDVLLSAVSLAVAAVPEGLPAVVTIALSIGVQRMAAREVLVRRLPAVETLGCATVICTDKTGTLTTGEMRVRELWGPDEQALLDSAAAASDAELSADGKSGVGDTTELAILMAAHERGIEREAIERARPRVAINVFDSVRKRMSIQRADGVLYVKGATEVLLPLCDEGHAGASEANAAMAARGLRVLAVARGSGPREEHLRFLGLIGIADPPRPEAIDAIREAREAGVRTVMITGDHPVTAHAIARELGLLQGEESADERVYARATPEDKLTIVRRFKSEGAVVAMTGDGVNDAPALREAHIGIAMGITGTEVAREASDMVLANDNFASIVAAVREGRGIFDNVQKTLVYLLSGNTGELVVMFTAALMGLPFPLLPLQLLWVNLVTDGMPALALVMDSPEADVLKRPPRAPEAPMLGKSQWRTIVATGLLEASVVLSTFLWALGARDVETARSLAFSTLVFGEVLRALAARSPTRLFLEVGAFTNRGLVGVTVFTLLLQFSLHQLPATQQLFQIRELSLGESLGSLALGAIPVSLLELNKLVRRALRKNAT